MTGTELLAGLDLILVSTAIGVGIFMAARALDGEETVSIQWQSLPTYSLVAPLLLVLVTAFNFHLWR